MILSNTINQRYRYAAQGKTPTQIQHELRELGVKGFVVKVAGSRVTMKVSECDIKKEQGVFTIDINNLYTYKATCTNVVDGDTIDILLDYGFDTYAKRRVRLLGVDTPERGQDKFKEATAFTRECVEHKDIYVQTYKSDVFGRYLANVWYEDGQRSLNDDLRDAGLLKENSKWNEG